MSVDRMKTINVLAVSGYTVVLVVFVVWNWLIARIEIVPRVVLAYYVITGFVFGLLECGVLVWLYVKERLSRQIVLLVLAVLYATGSIGGAIFYQFAL